MIPERLKYPGSIPRLLLRQGVEVVLRNAWTSSLRGVRSRIHVRSILDRKKAKGQQVKDNGIVVWISSSEDTYQDIKTEEKPCLLTRKRFLGCKSVWRFCYSHVAIGTHADVFPMERRMLCRVVRFVEAVLWADLHIINLFILEQCKSEPVTDSEAKNLLNTFDGVLRHEWTAVPMILNQYLLMLTPPLDHP